MGMFDTLLGRESREEKREKEIIAKNQSFAREQTAIQIGASVQDDRNFLTKLDDNADLTRWTQDLHDELEKLPHILRNEELINGKWVVKKIYIGQSETGQDMYAKMAPLINEFGIQMILGQVGPLLSRNMINSNFTEKRILILLKNTCDTIVDNLSTNSNDYGVEFTNMSLIMRIVRNSITPTPYRALNDGERKHLRTMNKRIEAYNESNDNANKSKIRIFGQ